MLGGFFVDKAAAGSNWNGMKMLLLAGRMCSGLPLSPIPAASGRGLLCALRASHRGSAGVLCSQSAVAEPFGSTRGIFM